MRRRAAFSLLELLISVNIAAILFSVLFVKIRDFVYLRKELVSTERECLERQTLQIRLQQLLSSVSSFEKDGIYSAPLYCKNQKVHFQIVNEFDANPSFVDMLIYFLWFDPRTKTLILSCKNPSGLEREEILATKVKSCSFSFYTEKEKKWKSTWEQNSKDPPTFLHISCKKESGEIEYLIPVTL